MKILSSAIHGNDRRRGVAGFTMVEIAICLAVIAFALVAIIGVLPVGMNVQKDNREQTIINFDANYLINLLRVGAQDTNSLNTSSITNYVLSITNVYVVCSTNGTQLAAPLPQTNWYTPFAYYNNGVSSPSPCTTNDAVIMGILGTPKYVYLPGGKYGSNSITVDMRAITGSVLDQGASEASRNFAFTYRVSIEIIPSGSCPYAYSDLDSVNFGAPGQLVVNNDPNLTAMVSNSWRLAKNVQGNLNEIRLTYRWPILPNGKTGPNVRVYRTSASGQIVLTPIKGLPVHLYYITPLNYAAVP